MLPPSILLRSLGISSKGQIESCSRFPPFSLKDLHSSSLFLLEDILAIDELTVIQINKDVGGMPVPQMMPYAKMVQDAGKVRHHPRKRRPADLPFSANT